MSQLESPPSSSTPQPQRRSFSFIVQAKIIGVLTLLSRILGLWREALAARYFGAHVVSTAFAVAFVIPNLFRKLLGEGGLSVSFIPLYAQAIKSGDPEANRFAAAAVKLQFLILLALTLLGEAVLGLIALLDLAPDRMLALRLTAIMLPYMMLVCAMAFLSGILNVHKRFAIPAATPILLNAALIISTIVGARLWGYDTLEQQTRVIYLVAVAVVVAGVLQVAALLPGLRAIGFRFDFSAPLRTPLVKKMLVLTIPVAIAAGVLQLSVVLDKAIAYFLSQRLDDSGRLITHFSLLGHSIPYPMALGAVARLNWAQFLYQFPLGIFSTALATAIFPMLSAEALDKDRNKFLDGLRQGLKVTLWEGLPASVGLILVARPAVQLLFERGNFRPEDTTLTSWSTMVFAAAIWALGVQQILFRAFYAMHDTKTPLLLWTFSLVVNLGVELPLLWTPLAEVAMALGTCVSFIAQNLLTIYLLRKRTGELGLGQLKGFALKCIIATSLMTAACLLVQKAPFFPADSSKATAPIRLMILVGTGAGVYIGACLALGRGRRTARGK